LKSLFKRICISSDHAGFFVKEYIKQLILKNKISIIDLGPNNNSSVDYPDFAKKVGKRVKSKKSDIGILICGSGTGMAMTANKIKDIRAAVCYNNSSTYLCLKHNNANILCLGSRLTKKKDIKKILSLFLSTKFEGGRHNKRIKKI
jgi:ribose 5-phosphate isomerase B